MCPPLSRPDKNRPWVRDLTQTIESVVNSIMIRGGVGSGVEWVMARPFGDAAYKRRFAWSCLRRGLVWSPKTTRAYVKVRRVPPRSAKSWFPCWTFGASNEPLNRRVPGEWLWRRVRIEDGAIATVLLNS